MEKILVIKLGALGDFVQAMGAFKAIRDHHKKSEITLMTTPPFEKMARDCGYFDKIWLDERKPFWDLKTLWQIRQEFRNQQFNRIYDLQCVSRTNTYFKYLLPTPKPHWSGVAPGCSHPHTEVLRSQLHTYDRHREQLKMVGFLNVPDPDLDWVKSDISRFNLPQETLLLIPGAAPGGERKQWPSEFYGQLAVQVMAKGVTPVVVGTKIEAPLADIIQSICPGAIDLTGQTSLYDIVALGRQTQGAVGNDTGPTHMIAQSACPMIVLFSNHSDPNLFGPRGKHVTILQKDSLTELSVEDVWNTVEETFLKKPRSKQKQLL